MYLCYCACLKSDCLSVKSKIDKNVRNKKKKGRKSIKRRRSPVWVTRRGISRDSADPPVSMRFEQDTACRGTHCASTPQPSALQQRSRLEEVVEEEVDSSAKDIEGQRRRRRELEANVVEGANTGPRAEAGGPGMAYPASATALNQHSAFATSIAGTPSSNPNGHISGGHLPAPAAPRPTDFSVSSLLTAATTHPPILGGSSSQGSASPPPGGPGSPAAAPETPPPLPSQRELSHPSSAVAAASYFSAAALAAAGFYNPAAHLPATSSPGPTAHHLQGKGILSSPHHHPHLNPHGITPPGETYDRLHSVSRFPKLQCLVIRPGSCFVITRSRAFGVIRAIGSDPRLGRK